MEPKETSPSSRATSPETTTDSVAETVRFGGTWYVVGPWYCKREGNRPDGRIIRYHDGHGNLYEGSPPEMED